MVPGAAGRRAKTLAEYAGVALSPRIATAQTLGIDEPQTMSEAVRHCWEQGTRLPEVKLDDHLLTEHMVAICANIGVYTLACRCGGIAANAAGELYRT